MKNLSNPENKDVYAIVSVGYNRLESQKRLLESLKNADYTGYANVPLVISIDCSGDELLYEYVHKFEWPHGDKHVIIRKERLGLKKHILVCGDLTQHFKGIVLFEDDLYVSKWFYHYIIQMDEVYGNCDKIASIGLYSNEMNGFCWLPFDRLKNGADVYAIQSVCTWGEAWNERMWSEFRNWFDNAEIEWDSLDVPESEKQWETAWSKYYDAFLVLEDKYSIFPDVSLSTNSGDAGEHTGLANDSLRFQVSLQYGKRDYQTLPFEDLLKYDAHFNSLNLFSSLGIERSELCVDLYGDRENRYHKKYYLSVQRKPYFVVKSFGIVLRPIELNVIEGICGNDIFLYDTTKKASKPKSTGLTHRVMYYQKGFNSLMIGALLKGHLTFLVIKCIEKLKRKLK